MESLLWNWSQEQLSKNKNEVYKFQTIEKVLIQPMEGRKGEESKTKEV